MNTLKTGETHQPTDTVNELITALQERVPSHRGIPLTPPVLKEPYPAVLPREGQQLVGLITHRQDVEMPEGAPVQVQQVIFKQERGVPGLESDESWRGYIVAPVDESKSPVYLWRSEDDPSRVSYGVFDSTEGHGGYNPDAEATALEDVAALLAQLDR